APAPATTIFPVLRLMPPASARVEGVLRKPGGFPTHQSSRTATPSFRKKGARGGNMVSPAGASRRRATRRRPQRPLHPPPELSSLFVGERAQRAPHVRIDRNAASRKHGLQRGLERESLQRRSHRREPRRLRVAHCFCDQLRERRAEGGHRADRSVREPFGNE